MQRLAAFLFSFTPATASAATYYLPEPAVPIWIWPLLAVLGIICLIAATWLRRMWLLPPGLALVLLGAAAERDITLAIGAALACAGLAWGMGKW